MTDNMEAKQLEPATEGASSRLRHPAMIGALATVAAAIIAGVFGIIAARGGSGSAQPSGVVTVLAALPTGSSGTVPQATDLGGGETGTFLADITAKRPPDSNDFSDSIGGRGILKAVGINSGGEADYDVPQGAKKFVAYVGLSDANNQNDNERGVFSVFGDVTELAQANLKTGEMAVISADVSGRRTLRLAFDGPGPNGLLSGDFGMARFIK
jgi:hypothetical protein